MRRPKDLASDEFMYSNKKTENIFRYGGCVENLILSETKDQLVIDGISTLFSSKGKIVGIKI